MNIFLKNKIGIIHGELPPEVPGELASDPKQTRDQGNRFFIDGNKGPILKPAKSISAWKTFWKKGLPPIQAPMYLRVFNGYIGSALGYRQVANQLRSPETPQDVRVQALIKQYDYILSQAKPYHAELVYRGAVFNKEEMTKIVPGRILHEPRYLSSTYYLESAAYYARHRLFRDGMAHLDLLNEKDKKIIDSQMAPYLENEVLDKKVLVFYIIEHSDQGVCTVDIGINPQEREVLIPKGQYYSVQGTGMLKEKKISILKSSSLEVSIPQYFFWLKIISSDVVGSAHIRNMMVNLFMNRPSILETDFS